MTQGYPAGSFFLPGLLNKPTAGKNRDSDPRQDERRLQIDQILTRQVARNSDWQNNHAQQLQEATEFVKHGQLFTYFQGAWFPRCKKRSARYSQRWKEPSCPSLRFAIFHDKRRPSHLPFDSALFTARRLQTSHRLSGPYNPL
jgi:hypothetical protein